MHHTRAISLKLLVSNCIHRAYDLAKPTLATFILLQNIRNIFVYNIRMNNMCRLVYFHCTDRATLRLSVPQDLIMVLWKQFKLTDIMNVWK